MKKYEAGKKFLEYFKEHPMDFEVTQSNGRDHSVITIRNQYRAVVVNLDVNGNTVQSTSFGDNAKITFIDDDTIAELFNLAKLRIEEDRIQAVVDKDNEAIAILTQYYQNK